ncbi:MAG: YciI family protein [Pyrinomonadaceae bacterium]
MKFINFVKYRDLDKIAGARPAHFAYADRLRAQGELAIGGPLLNDQGRRIGLLFIYEAVSRDAALALAQEDPFTLANALSSYEITEWRLRGVNLDLLIKANRSADQRGGKDTQIRLFANYAKYGADKSRLATVRSAHWEYDRTLKSAGRLALAGPFANDEGGLFVYNAVRREEAMSYLKQDPFAVEGVFADYELLEWLIEGVNPDLLASDFSSERSESAVTERELPKA